MRWGGSCLGRPLFALPGIMPVPTQSSWVDSRLLQPFYPNSQAFLSPRQSTPGLGNPVCVLTRSLPRASVHPCNLPFPPRPLPLAQVLTQCFSYCATQLCASFLQPLLYWSPFASFQLDFHEDYSKSIRIFDVFMGECEFHILLLCHLEFPSAVFVCLFVF